MIKKKDLSEEDKKTWDNFTNNLQIYMTKTTNANDNPRKNRLKYDLHGFTLDDANKKVKELILSCVSK